MKSKKNEAATGATVTASEPENLANQAEPQEPKHPGSNAVETKPKEPVTDAPEVPGAGSESAGVAETVDIAEPLPYLAQHFSLVPTGDLKPNPHNEEIYGRAVDDLFFEDIKRNGILQPLLISEDKVIIAGHRRHAAAIQAGIREVPVIVFHSKSEEDVLAALIESNKQRVKTNEQIAREFKALIEVEKIRARARMATKAKGGKKITQGEVNGKARDLAGVKLGISGPSGEKAIEVVGVIDHLEKKRRVDEAKDLRETLNKSFSGAHKKAVEAGWIEPSKPKGDRPPKQNGDSDASSGPATPSPGNIPATTSDEDDTAHTKAYEAADAVVTFFRSRESTKLNPQQKDDWGKIVQQILTLSKPLGINVPAK